MVFTNFCTREGRVLKPVLERVGFSATRTCVLMRVRVRVRVSTEERTLSPRVTPLYVHHKVGKWLFLRCKTVKRCVCKMERKLT